MFGYPFIAPPLKLEWPTAAPDVPEWERRPFALSKPEYYSAAYPGTQRARLQQAIKEHVESEKERKESCLSGTLPKQHETR